MTTPTSLDQLIVLSPDDARQHPFHPTTMDSGNGSLMRLAPVAIRFWGDALLTQITSERSSYTTHGGDEAAAACRFVGYFIARAIQAHHHDNGDTATVEGGVGVVCPMGGGTLSMFLDDVIADFTADICRRGEDQGPPYQRLLALLRCSPPSNKEACWNWKARELAVKETVTARGATYQGYPVSNGYFGSYALDGLSMALWAMYGDASTIDVSSTTSSSSSSFGFLDVLYRIVNLLGDADSTAAIACQMAGAYFGFSHMSGRSVKGESVTDTKGELGKRAMLRTMLACVKVWDPNGEVAARAVLLHQLGSELLQNGPPSTNRCR
jgi:hypothetical protein